LAYYYGGNIAESGKLFGEAAGQGSKAFVPFIEDLAKSLTMLGQTEERLGKNDKAMEAYQSALNVLRSGMARFDMYKVELSDALKQFGGFEFRQGRPGHARAAYEEAVKLRRATATATHPNCADAIKGLADVAAFEAFENAATTSTLPANAGVARESLTNASLPLSTTQVSDLLSSATVQAEQALKILDTALVPTHPRIAPTLVALASLYVLTGKANAAAPLDARIETILQKPLGPWKEDFLDTTTFYAGLLKKAGKAADAARLEQLHARQKTKR
jgi:tetratricopeptide (TPR) repeat protein